MRDVLYEEIVFEKRFTALAIDYIVIMRLLPI